MPLGPGRHKVRSSIDWAGSSEVEIEVPIEGSVTLRVQPSGTALQTLGLVGVGQMDALVFAGATRMTRRIAANPGASLGA